MPNVLDATGLTLATQDELISTITAAMQAAYGPNINTASDTPDGQMLNIYVRGIQDVQDLIAAVYNSFDPDNAVGVVLDQRIAINGIERQAGTYTITNITIVTTQSVNLYGKDQSAQAVYSVSDSAGNLWQLQTTQLAVAAGTHAFSFQAALPGAVTTTPNTITTQVTIVLGVASVNNPTTYTTLGVNEESDPAAKIRRQKSVSLASQGYLPGLLAALENIPGMTAAFVYENKTSTTDANGVPPHCIWVIVSGTAAAADIAQAIYTKRNAGCDMKGTQTYNITEVNGNIFVVQWDNVIAVNLFIKFTATSLNGVTAPNVGAIRTGLVTSFVPGVAAEVNINALATQVQIIDPNTLVTVSGFATGQTQVFSLSGIPASGTFKINYNGNLSATINWNDSNTTIQTNLRANVAGLATVVVTGSLATTLTFDLSTINSVLAFLYITNNTLMTSVPAAITPTYNHGFTSTLTPASKQYQFVVSAANIYIVPIVLLPATSVVAHTTGTVAFKATGGYGAYTFSISTNNSGGAINATTGAYTAGATPVVTDTIKVIDVLGNSTTATVTVS